MEKWMVAAKRADFKGIGEWFGIDQVTARIIRNRDVIGEKAIEKYLHGSRSLAVERYGKGSGYPAGENRKQKQDPDHRRL